MIALILKVSALGFLMEGRILAVIIMARSTSQVGYDDVEIIYNSDGRPAGVAYVTFSSPSLAQRAVKEKNGQHIGNRYVDLRLS